jgi:putative ABC transport system permease protein
MNLLDNLSMAIASLRSAKMRSFLTMLGIIIGIASVIAIMTIGNSLNTSVSDALTSFGATNITLSVTQKSSSTDSSSAAGGFDSGGRMFMRDELKESDLISDEMIAAYREEYANEIDAIELSESVGTATISDQGNEVTVNILGVNPDYLSTNEVTMITGRYISEEDLDNKRSVCMVSDVFAQNLFGTEEGLIGKTIRMSINGYTRELYIVGEYQYENMTTSEDTSDVTTTLYMPITTAKKYMFSNDGYSSITIVASADVDTTAFMEETQTFFASYYTANDTYTVEASSLESMVETMNEVMSNVTMAVAAIAAISLIVGGVGVMNIMLVSITERTREIGTRKALGATRGDIRLQFITEAVIICLIGGIIGIILGTILGTLGASMLGITASPSLSAIMFSTLFSISIGIFFGYYPADKAAKLNPIDALRYE